MATVPVYAVPGTGLLKALLLATSINPATDVIELHGDWHEQVIDGTTAVPFQYPGTSATTPLRLVAGSDFSMTKLEIRNTVNCIDFDLAGQSITPIPGVVNNVDKTRTCLKVCRTTVADSGAKSITFRNGKFLGLPTLRYARCISIEGFDTDQSKWPTDISFIDCEAAYSYGDLRAIYGGRNIAFVNFKAHDATTPADNTPGWANDHVDGLQVTNCVPAGTGLAATFPNCKLIGFPLGLYVENDRTYNSTVDLTETGNFPHQGLILGTVPANNEVINGVYINGATYGQWDDIAATLPQSGWNGTPVVIAGANTTNVVVKAPRGRRARGNVSISTTAPPGAGCVVLDADFA